jgi:hypothetical protein
VATPRGNGWSTLFLCVAAIAIASFVSHLVANWIPLREPQPTYRRVGPDDGPQVLCAGSSLLQFGLTWPRLSEALAQGIEGYGLGGSTPIEWEVFQSYTPNTNTMIIGLSLYDMNEHRFCESSASIIPLADRVGDLRQASLGWEFAKQSLSQYPLSYLRKVFPTAGNSASVLVGMRSKLPTQLRAESASEDEANTRARPQNPNLLEFPGSEERIDQWARPKVLRRLSRMRNETKGRHAFNGPKRLAVTRMLKRAQERGRIIIAVLPVSPSYLDELTTPDVGQEFEKAVAELHNAFPTAAIVRLDQLEPLRTDAVFADPVHLNAAGQQIATDAFLEALGAHGFAR